MKPPNQRFLAASLTFSGSNQAREGRLVDALAVRGDEGRLYGSDMLRGVVKHALIRRFPNGETHLTVRYCYL